MTALADRGTSGNAVGVILVPLQTGYDPGATNLTTGGRSVRLGDVKEEPSPKPATVRLA